MCGVGCFQLKTGDLLCWLFHHEESSKMESESDVDSDRDDMTDEQSDIDDIEL